MYLVELCTLLREGLSLQYPAVVLLCGSKIIKTDKNKLESRKWQVFTRMERLVALPCLSVFSSYAQVLVSIMFRKPLQLNI